MAFKSAVLMSFVLFVARAVAEEAKDPMKQESKVIFEKTNEEKNGKLNQVELAKEVEPEDKAEGSEPEEAAMEEGAEEDNMEAGADGDEEPEAAESATEGWAEEEEDIEANANDDEAFSAAN